MQTSSDKLLLGVDGNQHQDPQIDNEQSLRYFGALSSKENVCITPYLEDSGIYAKEETELLHEPEVVDNLKGNSHTRGLMCIQTHGL